MLPKISSTSTFPTIIPRCLVANLKSSAALSKSSSLFLLLKFLRFPMVTYANSIRRRNIARIAAAFAFTLTLYACWTFYNALKESEYDVEYSAFLNKEINLKSTIEKIVKIQYNRGPDDSDIWESENKKVCS